MCAVSSKKRSLSLIEFPGCYFYKTPPILSRERGRRLRKEQAQYAGHEIHHESAVLVGGPPSVFLVSLSPSHHGSLYKVHDSCQLSQVVQGLHDLEPVQALSVRDDGFLGDRLTVGREEVKPLARERLHK